MIRTHRKGDIKGTYLNRVKSIYDKPTASVILIGERYNS